jgi:hypothetical protein
MLVESVTGYVLQMTVYQEKRFDPTPVGILQGGNNKAYSVLDVRKQHPPPVDVHSLSIVT